MSLSRLPSGRWRCQIYDSGLGRNVSVGTFDTKREAKKAREDARGQTSPDRKPITVHDWWVTWTTDPLWERPKGSTNKLNHDITRAFVLAHKDLPLAMVSDLHAAAWLAGGKRNSHVSKLRAMFNDACSAKAGRLLATNPFAGLRIAQSRGNADKTPPSEATVWALIEAARKLTHPSFAAWLQVAAFTGMRPGELDALRWSNVDFEAGRIAVVEQFSATTGTFSSPKNGKRRPALLTPQAREALMELPREEQWCFTNIRGGHLTASSRAYHWKAVRAAVGYAGTLYLSTRHWFGWYAINVLMMTPEDVATALGHTDGGLLVRRLYGHLDTDLSLGRVEAAFENYGTVVPFKRKDTA